MLKFWSLTSAIAGATFALHDARRPSGRIRRRHGQRHDADRRDPGAAAAARPRIREADRREDQRHRGSVLRPLPEGADRLGERHQLGRRRGVRAAMDGRLCGRRLSRGPRAAHRQGQEHQVGRDWSVLPQLLGDLRRQDLPRSARWRFPHALLSHGRAGESGPEAAEDLGRISRGRQGVERQGLRRRPRATAPASPRSATRRATGSSPTSPARWSSRRERARARSSTPRT